MGVSVHTRRISHNGFPEVLTIDLDLSSTTFSARLLNVYLYNFELGNCYGGTTEEAITADVTALVDFAVGQVYNRLWSIDFEALPSHDANHSHEA